MRLGLVMATVIALLATAVQAGIEGGDARQAFVPGDRVIYESRLKDCPVGELLAEWRVAQGGYECARFNDHIWIRPLSHGTMVWLPIDPPLPDEFSLEMVVHPFADGAPMLRLALHPAAIAERIGEAPGHELVAGVVRGGQPSVFGAKDDPNGTLDGRFAFEIRLEPGADHHVAIEARRGQIRFFVDGRRIGVLPFHPAAPIGVLSLTFRRTFGTNVPFADAPVLVRRVRLAGYSGREAAPKPEEDLAAELGAVKTDEGLKITLENRVLFDFGKWELRPEARAVLEKVARLAKGRSGTVRIEGHTDDVGSASFNKVLSELRAHVVALALARAGVDPARLRPVGFGESRPLVPNTSEANRARNRRVEIVLEDGM